MKITVYGKPKCIQCNYTKQKLTKDHVVFDYIDVTENEEKLEYIKNELGFSSLPVVEADFMEPFSGFKPGLLSEIANKYEMSIAKNGS